MEGLCTGPSPTNMAIVRRESFPRVPPELLLREHAAKFNLMGMGLTSLLEAMKPPVRPVPPPLTGSGDCSVKGFLNSRNDGLLPRKKPLPHTNIKKSTGTLYFSLEGAYHPPSCNGHTAVGSDGNDYEASRTGCLFSEVDTSRLTAVELVRRPGPDASKRDAKTGKQLPRATRREIDTTRSEREVLWGYNTGAVIHVTLCPFAADLRTIRRPIEEAKRLRDQGFSVAKSRLSQRQGSTADDSGWETSPDESSRDASEGEESNDNVLLSLREKVPRGISLLGYHSSCTVSSLTYHPRHDLAISGGVDGSLCVWDLHNHYKQTLRERRNQEEDIRGAKTVEQFVSYVRTRKLTQTIVHAHHGCVTSIEAFNELLLSGGMDGAVKAWRCQVENVFGSLNGLPKYIEYQVFNSTGWVRQICLLKDRFALGGDLMVCSEDGAISSFKSSTVPQRTQVSGTRETGLWGKPLLEALRNHKNLKVEVKTQNTQPSSRGGCRQAQRGDNHPFFTAVVRTRKEKIDQDDFPLSYENIDLPCTLSLTRTVHITSEEARLARSTELKGRKCHDGTSSITRLLPLGRHNVLIAIGYSPFARLLDMSRLKPTSIVLHPSLRTLSELGTQPAYFTVVDQKQQMKKLNSQQLIGTSSQMQGKAPGVEPLRFVDVLYIVTVDYLILLDNRNTVFVWDTTANKQIISHHIPDVSEGGRNNVALKLLPCGTRYYEETCTPGETQTTASPREYVPSRSLPKGRSMFPFFVVCTMGLELYDLVISVYAELAFKAHKDRVIGMYAVRQPCATSRRYILSPYPVSMNGCNDQAAQRTTPSTSVCPPESVDVERRGLSSATPSGREVFNFTVTESSTENVEQLVLEGLECEMNEVDDHYQLHTLTCSGDGVIHVWGNSFQPICSYNNDSLKKNFAELRIRDLSESESTEPVGKNNEKTTRKFCNREKDIVSMGKFDKFYDTTSFFYSPQWNMAITGHDDGGIRFWQCEQQLPRCTWYRGAHKNSVSGIVGARIPKRSLEEVLSLVQRGNGSPSLHLGWFEVLATVSYDGWLKVWGGASEAMVVLNLSTKVSNNELLCVEFSEIGQYFIVGDNAGVISTWNAHKLDPLFSIPSKPPIPLAPRPKRLFSMQNKAAIGQNPHGENTAYSATTPNVHHTEGVTVLVVDGNFVFSGGEDGRVLLWNLTNGELVREYFLEPFSSSRSDLQSVLHGPTVPAILGGGSSHGSNDRAIARQGGGETGGATSSIVSILLLRERNGDLLIATNGGFIYHFFQKCSSPRQAYRHTSTITSICVLNEGCETEQELRDSVKEVGDNTVFELAIGGDDGQITVLHETKFSRVFSAGAPS
uniref:Uncharacterized protein n=1 Tax=Trypanosoma congolense (strain IL3000) TaxID=1068625 RepID=G0UYG3_TRYCI|nr:conserved hypothetical protein [Trypanosoma congolense IL3000]